MSGGREGGIRALPARAPLLAFELSLAGAGLVLAFTLAAGLPSWRTELGPLQVLMLAAFGFYALALLRLPAWRDLPGAGVAVVVVALALRLAVLRVEPALSDDVWRYLWDGRVSTHGVDPWAHAPASPALDRVGDPALRARVNHPGLRTIYPPLAEAGFALVAGVAPGLTGMKAWILLHDLALVAVLAAWCARRGGSALPAIAYAWNPLVVLEYAGSAHHDPTGLLWLVVALAVARARPTASALALAAAVMVKLLPLVALPFLWREWNARARIVAVAAIAAGTALFLSRALGEGSGLQAYAGQWRNNESVFALAASVVGDARARGLAALAVAGAVAWALRRGEDAGTGTRTALRTALLAGPVLHPWYLGWALALEPLAPSPPWLVLSATVLLSYGVFHAPAEGGAFHLGLAGRAVEYGVPLALAAVLAFRRRLRAGHEVP